MSYFVLPILYCKRINYLCLRRKSCFFLISFAYNFVDSVRRSFLYFLMLRIDFVI